MKKLDVAALLKELTLEEKARLVAGHDFMHTCPIPRLSIPSVAMADGPHGLRKQVGSADNGISTSLPSTAFPTAATIANSWDEENAYQVGAALAVEAKSLGVSLVLGPGVNLKRNPLGGRNFEYFSEDPLLSGKMAASEIRGLEENGVGSCPKHFALNESENYRFLGNTVVDERTARELYLKAFEIAVKEGRPTAIMCAYNRINGTFASENQPLLNDLLREEWGFGGLTLTDWGAIHERLPSLRAGLDLEMPGDTSICRKWIIDGIRSGELTLEDLDRAVTHVLNFVNLSLGRQEDGGDPSFDRHREMALEVALEGAVLLQNEGALPLREEESYFVTGDLFAKMRYQGAGSSMINPARLDSPKAAFDAHGVSYAYSRGYRESDSEVDEKLIKEALLCMGNRQKALVFAGLTDFVESEGADRETMELPKPQLALIDALSAAGKDVVVILYGGSPVEVPFLFRSKAVLAMYLPGEAGGEATYQLLFGRRNPAGRLAETWPKTYADVPFGNSFGKGVNEIYLESLYLGYRYYASCPEKVRFPFGYGLSYTRFEWSSFSSERVGDAIFFRLEVANRGSYEGSEVVQLYVRKKSPDIVRVPLELKGYRKIRLAPGERKTITLEVKLEELRYYDADRKAFLLEGGPYEFLLAKDSLTPIASFAYELEGVQPARAKEAVREVYFGPRFDKDVVRAYEELLGGQIPEEPPERPITLESRFSDLESGFLGKILFKAVTGVADKQARLAAKLPPGIEADNKKKGALFLRRILVSNSLRSMSMSAGKSFPYNFAQGFVELSNGRLLRGAKAFLTPIQPSKKEKK